MKKNQYNIILLIVVLISLSCSPSKRMARIIKKHPELSHKTTIEKDTVIEIPAVEDSNAVDINTNIEDTTEAILEGEFHIDSAEAKVIAKKLNVVISNKTIIKDTTIINGDGVKTTIKQKGNKLIVTNDKPKKKIVVPQTINKTDVEVKDMSFTDKLLRWMGLFLLIAIILAVVRKVVKSYWGI